MDRLAQASEVIDVIYLKGVATILLEQKVVKRAAKSGDGGHKQVDMF